MQIGILSDSHFKDEEIRENNGKFQDVMKRLKHAFKGVDHIIHAGDVCCESFIRVLTQIAPVSVVQGNMDEFFGIKKWPKTLTLDFEGIRIGISHSLENLAYFGEKEIRVFIYGHTHIPNINENQDGVLLINPGSITKPKLRLKKYLFQAEQQPQPTIALLQIQDGLLSSFIKRL